MMGQEDFPEHELVSALADGQLAGDEFSRALVLLAESDQAMAAWHAYHLVGDALRGGDLADGSGDMAFVARLRGQLEVPAEARLSIGPIMQTGVALSPASALTAAAIPHTLKRESANDSVVRWKLLAGVASLVAVAAVGWVLAGVGLGGASQLAAVPGNTATASAVQAGSTNPAEPTVMLRDARLDELLAAHKQFGGTSALQMPAGFLRNATFESPGR